MPLSEKARTEVYLPEVREVSEPAETGEQSVSHWFAAHIVMYVEFKAGEQTTFPVWENIVLIQAASEKEAFEKAEKKGRESAGDDGGTFRWGKKRASWVFGGVRKLTLCDNPEERPGDGTELSYIELEVRSKKSLNKLIRSENVGLQLRDGFPEEDERMGIPAERRDSNQNDNQD